MDKKSFFSQIWAKLLISNKDFFKRGDKVLVGVSGGADSVCLLHFLTQLAQKKRFRVYACHINHSLRENAKKDELFTKKLCEQLGVELFVITKDVKNIALKNKLSIEHAARKARYSAFESAAKKINAGYLALAHHLDDNVETFFLNILRGTKAKGLTGIPRVRPLNKNTVIIRPLLNIRRQDVINYVKFNKLKFITDETNSDEKYTRNWVRNKLLPMVEKKQPQIREHILLISKDLEKECRK
ncbi:tRNA(Ile)-lysidine synthetase [Elusimicrobium minutum Pei191]|uniref:tRNA(Ile)-lysidine synthase n=1 Tax=Elusimicrobium minutum (strain Pei191) TaxID=445932 RepID=B2KF01_ELUMP|nr:tRNA lysidine(34) synthetase TilS [Elusimicrobium minutum]ACC99097.1 tRNA(Ile)-lysidine synthetase [Elusimicrobium minutum Pei191]